MSGSSDWNGPLWMLGEWDWVEPIQDGSHVLFYHDTLRTTPCCFFCAVSISNSDPVHVCFHLIVIQTTSRIRPMSKRTTSAEPPQLSGVPSPKRAPRSFNRRGEHHEVNRLLRKFWFSDGLDVQLARVAWFVLQKHKKATQTEKIHI